MFRLEEDPEGVWWHLSRLLPDGELHKPFFLLPRPPDCSFPALLHRLDILSTGEQQCVTCGQVTGQLLLCSCLTRLYCGEDCRAVDKEHLARCVELEEQEKEGAVLPSRVTEQHRQRANRLAGWLRVEGERREKAEDDANSQKKKRIRVERDLVRLRSLVEKLRKEKGFPYRALTKHLKKSRAVTKPFVRRRAVTTAVTVHMRPDQEVLRATRSTNQGLKVLVATVMSEKTERKGEEVEVEVRETLGEVEDSPAGPSTPSVLATTTSSPEKVRKPSVIASSLI